MDDLISRQAAIDMLIELSVQRDAWDSQEGFAQKRGINASICAIEDLPSAERRGKKKVYYHGENTFSYVCDQCSMPIDDKDAFCRWCGAKMEV